MIAFLHSLILPLSFRALASIAIVAGLLGVWLVLQNF